MNTVLYANYISIKLEGKVKFENHGIKSQISWGLNPGPTSYYLCGLAQPSLSEF